MVHADGRVTRCLKQNEASKRGNGECFQERNRQGSRETAFVSVFNENLAASARRKPLSDDEQFWRKTCAIEKFFWVR